MSARSGHFERHRMEAELENIHFLRDECGLHVEAIARRLGLTVDNVEQKLGREKRAEVAGAEPDPHQVA